MSISNRLRSLDYTGDKARRDLVAGLTVAAVSLPQGITYALVAGLYIGRIDRLRTPITCAPIELDE